VRLGVFGGTFDPPHLGHWLAAVDAFETLALDRLLFVPAAAQPLKTDRTTAPAADRLAMVRALVEGDSRFGVSGIEIDRPGLSYTVDTLAQLAREHPGAELSFLVGRDVLESFSRWREPGRVLTLARLVVLTRAGDAGGEGKSELLELARATAGAHTPVFLESRRVDVSSTEVRRRVAAAQSIRGFVPEAVDAYMMRAGLYR
jgi:nicotinate-nucleotide adenylyltransferase